MEIRTRPPTQEQSAIVERVARIVSRVRGAKPDYARLAAELEPAIPFDVFGIVLLRHDKAAVRVVVCTREADGWVANFHQHPLKDSMFDNILKRCKSPSVGISEHKHEHTAVEPHVQDLSFIDIRNYPDGLDGSPAESGDALSGRPYLRSTLMMPLVVGDQVIGALELGSTRIDAYSGEALQRLISSVAHVLAAAIESAQIGGSVEIQDRQREELKNVSKALVSEMDLVMILNRIVAGIAKALDVSSAIITLDHRRGNLKMIVEYGLDRFILEKIAASEIGLTEQAIIGTTLHHHQPHFSNDIAGDERFPSSRIFASQLGIRSIFCFPLVSGSSLYGVLLLCSAEPGGFTPLKLDILSLFASQATIALHNGMLLESARERKRFQEAIERFGAEAQRESNSDEEELALFREVRKATEQNFGMSFNGLLRFISGYLLTSNERDLQKILQDVREDQVPIPVNTVNGTKGPSLAEQEAAVPIEAAEAAFVQAGLLGNVHVVLAPVILQLFERIRSDMTSPWFVIDGQGKCVYANRAAEIFCGINMSLDQIGNLASLQRSPQKTGNDAFNIDLYDASWSIEKRRHLNMYFTNTQDSSITLLDAFSGLFSRIRNVEDMRQYLEDFSKFELASDDMEYVGRQRNFAQLELSPASRFRFVVATEPLPNRIQRRDRFDTEVTGEGGSHIIAVPSTKEARNRFSGSRTMVPNSAPSDRHYQCVSFSLYDSQSHHLGYALQVEDITEQVRDEKNKAVLLSTVSHDLRTPLTAIKAAVTGLLQPGITWDVQLLQEILEDVDSETDHLLSQINSFIEMSRIDMGALALEKEWCEIKEIVHSVLADDKRLLEEHPVRIDIPKQLPMVYVDFVQIKRVLHCLLENAVHHNPEHAEIVIAVDSINIGDEDIVSTKDTQKYLRVKVIDHGPGIPYGERERIFKTFYSLDAQGSGLGLSISRGIIEAHQGRITFEPVMGGGSCFAFVLPIS